MSHNHLFKTALNATLRKGSLVLLCLCTTFVLSISGCAKTDEDCVEDCKQSGLCKAEGSYCIAADDSKCKESRLCYYIGECTLSKESKRCTAKDDSDCKGSLKCKEDGRCLARNGECIEVTTEYCKSLEGCKKLGQCTLSRRTFTCIPGTKADCEASEACTNGEKCQLEKEVCVVSDEFCRFSENCKKLGKCSRIGNSCLPRFDQDCENAEVCSKEKKCLVNQTETACVKTRAGVCKSPCKRNEDCTGCPKKRGICDQGICSDKKCSESPECKSSGQCSRKAERCIASKSSDCTKVCKENGHCTVDPKTEKCIAGSDKDCAQSDLCKKKRFCKVNKDKGVCQLDPKCKINACKNNDECSSCTSSKNFCLKSLCVTESAFCKTTCEAKGLCSYDKTKKTCIAKTDEDCKKGKVCKDEGKCTAEKGSCIKK